MQNVLEAQVYLSNPEDIVRKGVLWQIKINPKKTEDSVQEAPKRKQTVVALVRTSSGLSGNGGLWGVGRNPNSNFTILRWDGGKPHICQKR